MNNSSPVSKIRGIALMALATLIGGGVILFAAWYAINSPVLASTISSPQAQDESARPQPFAQMNIPKPEVSSAGAVAVALPVVTIPTVTEIPSAQPQVVEILPTATAEILPTAETTIYTPTVTPTVEQPTATPDVNSPSGMVYAEVLADTPTPEGVPTTEAYAPATGSGERWIDVDLSQQRVYAYEGDTVVNSFIVSTGTWQTPTVTGKYNIWVKLRSAPMSGPGYYLPNVPYVMYFYGSYGLHGTYWHNNFGTPMSHGCVNLSIPDSEWLYNFASVGTVVNVHY